MAERVAFGQFEGRFIAEAADRQTRTISLGLDRQDVVRAAFFVDPLQDTFVAASLNGFLSSVMKSSQDTQGMATYLNAHLGIWKKSMTGYLQRRSKENLHDEWHAERLMMESDMIGAFTIQDIHTFAQGQFYDALEQQKSALTESERRHFEKEVQKWEAVCEVTHVAREQKKDGKEKDFEQELCEDFVEKICGRLNLDWQEKNGKADINKEAIGAVDEFFGWQVAMHTIYRQGEKTDALKAKRVSSMTLLQMAFIATRRRRMADINKPAFVIGENKSNLDASVRYWPHAEKVMQRAVKIERKRESRR